MRGRVYFVDLSPRSGSEESGRRPCVIVSTDAFNCAKGWRSITIVPITSSARWMAGSPTTVALTRGEAGLTRNCAVLAHQITTIDRSKLTGDAIGRLSDRRLAEIERAILNYLEIAL